jgi:hypothetical protein
MEQQVIEIKYLAKIVKSKHMTRTWASQQEWSRAARRRAVGASMAACRGCSHLGLAKEHIQQQLNWHAS